MNVPLLGPLTFSDFADGWFFLYLVVVAVLTVLYTAVVYARRKRVMRFANMALLEQVAPQRRQTRWRHLPAALLVAALAMLTTAMAGPTHDVRIPRNRAVVMLVIDISESMVATDVAPSRIEAAKAAGKAFSDELTPGINLGLVAFGGTATLLVPPTTNRDAMKAAIDQLQPQERTATGEAIFTALQAIANVVTVIGGGDGKPPPARIVLESDGKETVPVDLDAPRGAFTAARAAKDQGVQISTISFGTTEGSVNLNGTDIPVPVDDDSLRKIADLSGGRAFQARSLGQLKSTYAALQQQIGYETIKGDASAAWIGLGALLMTAALAAAAWINRELPD